MKNYDETFEDMVAKERIRAKLYPKEFMEDIHSITKEVRREVIKRYDLPEDFEFDNNFYLADFDGLIFLIRGDLCPVPYYSAWMELQCLIRGFGEGEAVPYETLMETATKEELMRLRDPKADYEK